MSSAELAWKLLTNSVGNYFGTGENHEGQQFESQCSLSFEIPNKLILLKSKAISSKGEVYHDEVSWIGRDDKGQLCLYVNSSNHLGITVHSFYRIEETSEGGRKITFRYGNPSDMNSFREDITFLIKKNYNFEHTYSWALPGQKLDVRSVANLKKINDSSLLITTNDIETNTI